MTVRVKLMGIAVTAVCAMVVIMVVGIVGDHQLSDITESTEAALAARAAQLQTRRVEKNFLARPDQSYVREFEEEAATLRSKVHEAAIMGGGVEERAATVEPLFESYVENFAALVENQRVMGHSGGEGLRGKLADAAGNIEDTVRTKRLDDLLASLLMLRRLEAEFMLRGDATLVEKFKKELQVFRRGVEDDALLDLADETGDVLRLTDAYGDIFEAYATHAQHLKAAESAMVDSARLLEPAVVDLVREAQTAGKRLDRRIGLLVICAEGVSAFMLVVMIALVIRSIIGPLSRLQDYARQVAGGDFNEVAADGFSGELKSLHGDITAMVGEIKAKLAYSDGVLTGITMPAVIVDAGNHIIRANPQICALLEKSEEPATYAGMTTGELFFNDSRHETLTSRSLEARRRMEDEISVVSDGGRELLVSVTSTPFYDMDGELLGALTMWYDLTELRRQQELVEEQNRVIAQAATDADGVSEQVASASEELSAQIEEASRGAREQRSRTSEVATAVEEMNATVLEVAKNASSSAELANEARGKAQEGRGLVVRMVTTNADLEKLADSLKVEMADLGRQADGIGTIMGVISDIADQTNLLALNAAIEAARAGEAGRGFAVVADEVRKLAEKTMQATGEVGGYIQSIQQSAHRNIQATEETTEVIQKSAAMSEEAGNALDEIVRFVEQTNDQVCEIATASEQQSAASEQIARAAEEINGTALETAQAMGESADAVSGLAHMAGDLKEIIGRMQN